MDNIKETIKKIAKDQREEVIKIRRHIHQYPELSFQEHKTSQYIKNVLTENDVEYTGDWVKTGIVALIEGELGAGKVVAIRADIDALPITEVRNVAYKSKNKGVMHACGHDVHSSSVLGTVLILNRLKAHFKGTVKVIFQPGEEKLPGGASLMIDEGVLNNPVPDVIFGQHVHPPLDTGTFGVCQGEYMASADEIYISIFGKGGHAALPQNCVDPILIASQVVVALQSIVSRNANPLMPSVLSIGKINSVGGATNVVPNEVILEGTFRTFDEDWRATVHERIVEIASLTAKAHGGSAKVNIVKGYPTLDNETALTLRTIKGMKAYLGEENCIPLPKRMTSEDFAFYSQSIPACFYRMGTGNDAKDTRHSVHTNLFDIDEDAMEVSSGLMAWLVWSELMECK